MIVTLFITIVIEGLVVLGYAFGRGKPVCPILLSSICINILTQSLLWLGLNLFFQHYIAALIIAEVLIWGVEGSLLYAIPANQLQVKDAILLSLIMNLMSFGLGWFLPI